MKLWIPRKMVFLSSSGNPESSNCSGFHAKNLEINEVPPKAHESEWVEIGSYYISGDELEMKK